MLLMLCMVVSLLPSTALAAEEDTAETPDQEQCAQLPGCGEEVHDVDCPLYAGPEEDMLTNQAEESRSMGNTVTLSIFYYIQGSNTPGQRICCPLP